MFLAGEWGLPIFQCRESLEDTWALDANGDHTKSVIGSQGLD